MSDEKHSPGPWKWEWSTGYTELNSADGTVLILRDEDNGVLDDDDPDARLIASAPDMLALLKRFSGCTCCGHRQVAEEAAALADRIEGKVNP